jgi:hypothetical protein
VVVAPDPQLPNDAKKHLEFLVKDYELKVQYLTNHFGRMWTRFNYFVVIQAALIGGKTIFGDSRMYMPGMWFGLALSLVWYIIGAEDRFLVQQYRDQVEEAAAQISQEFLISSYRYVGDPKGANDMFKSPRRGWMDHITAWRWEPISTTRLASLLPLTVSLVWLGVLIHALVTGSAANR